MESAGGAKSEYQEMVREFEILTKALVHIDHLKAADEQMTAQLNYIKFAALSCRYPLQDFMTKMEEYDSSLGIIARMNMMRKAARKVRWSFGPSGDIKQLRMYLNTHVGTINMLLAEYGLEQMTSASVKSEENFMQVSRKLDKNQALLVDVKSDTSNLGHSLSDVQSILRGDIGTSLGQLLVAMGQNRLSTEQVHTSIAEITRSLRDLDTGMTYLQKPFHVEDALGFTYAIPSELGYRMLYAYIRCRFAEGAGSRDVALGNYEFFRADRRSLTITSSSQLTPGTRIVMAVIVKANVKSVCARPGCASVEARPYPGGGFICSQCDLWFDKTTRFRQEIEPRVSEVDELSTSIVGMSMNDPVQSPWGVSNTKDQRCRGDSGDAQLFRNVTTADPNQSFEFSAGCLVM
ncbi:hypothetical protein J4E81_008667 [Alternaria sp. BMP 2799]|nr:hypothetical protein J4E81_008667 [Alternaria sp. BMP 2799]